MQAGGRWNSKPKNFVSLTVLRYSNGLFQNYFKKHFTENEVGVNVFNCLFCGLVDWAFILLVYLIMIEKTAIYSNHK